MQTENLQTGTVGMGSDFTSDVWFTELYDSICFEFSWTGSNSTTGTIEIQVSVSKDYWSCYGGDNGKFSTTSGTSHGHVEIKDITYPYWRVVYTKNSVSAGELVIRTYGKPKFPRT